MVSEVFDNQVFFFDHILGKIYSYNSRKSNSGIISKVWDVDTDHITSGITLYFSAPRPGTTHRVHSMAQGK